MPASKYVIKISFQFIVPIFKLKLPVIIVLFLSFLQPAEGQVKPNFTTNFFTQDSLIEVSIKTDIKQLRGSKSKPAWQPAEWVAKLNDKTIIKGQVDIEMRGNIRKSICDIATLAINFKTLAPLAMSSLKKLKMVGGCRGNRFDEELLLREYLVYKIYNLITPLSFRVRLLRVTYNDSRNKMDPYTQYAFLIEDADVLAKRNGMVQKKTGIYKTEAADRMHTTRVCLFEYMIGNTDWSITGRHNVKLLVPYADTLTQPFVVPYDFDYAGLINAPYAVPSEDLEISNVRERLYKGYRRTEEELQQATSVFREKKDSVLQVVNACAYLDNNARKDMVRYLDYFFDVISRQASIKRVFINNARN